ncbi:PHP domain-containing protein [Methylomonas sp. SURF-1]|uniref:PHP domain-containing protein n=1 Tax=Methylomonas aurea TaxID=2952224 RepID=A0ABT1UG80_9GAMM|nr:PHP domain-containing protein [Methylomonas sp. SURF-1]MCQ8181246.1 PHP domain-containing protein [Methylomonas sp. SURF-1]
MSDLIYDLHCHSTASDGALPPAELVNRAKQQGVGVLALTDHDTVAGLAEARQAAQDCGIRLVQGIELSAGFESHCLHIVGLNIDPTNSRLLEGIGRQQITREERAQKIAQKLVKKGIPDAYPELRAAAGNGEITRLHFADFLVKHGYVETQQDAFDRYLSKGKPGYVPTAWAPLADCVDWIRQAGGVAVLAHPLRYKLSTKWLDKALIRFKAAGGQGIEVVTGRASIDDIRLSYGFALKHGLYASQGSDFHAPGNQYVELGRLAALPAGADPVWNLF